jgi:putative oxidoreductase
VNFIRSFFLFIGRFSIALLFVLMGLDQAMNWDLKVQALTIPGLIEYPQYVLMGAIAIELIGGLAFAFGCKPKFAAFVLALFLIPSTYFYYNFWMLVDPAAIQELQAGFFKNLAIFGGLVCYIASPSMKVEKAEKKDK